MTNRERFHVELEARPDAVPAETRLKKLLKSALRVYGFKCRTAVAVLPTAHAAADFGSPGSLGGAIAFTQFTEA